MKKTTQKLLLAAVILLAASSSASAQSTATTTATASATIIAPITIAETVNMNFGNVVSSNALGTVVLSAGSAPSRNVTGGTTLTATAGAGTITSAEFTVGGEGAYTYAVTMPSTAVTLTSPASGSIPMTIDNFTNDLGVGGATAATGTLTAGAQTFYVGATLHVGANQTAGAYTTSTGFSVTVNYN